MLAPGALNCVSGEGGRRPGGPSPAVLRGGNGRRRGGGRGWRRLPPAGVSARDSRCAGAGPGASLGEAEAVQPALASRPYWRRTRWAMPMRSMIGVGHMKVTRTTPGRRLISIEPVMVARFMISS
jgi:hypothetical protein